MGKNHWPAVIVQAPLIVLAACTLAACTLAACTLAACAAAPIDNRDIPAALRVPPNAALTQQVHAVGVQIYRCAADKSDPARFAWLLKAPEASLSDHSGIEIGKHYAGPTWEARDGSKVVGEVAARASPDPSAVAWLLLNAKSTSGSGIFASVRFVQRLRTVGGNAPADGCSQATADSEVRVPYSAEYWFYANKH